MDALLITVIYQMICGKLENSKKLAVMGVDSGLCYWSS